MYQNFHCPYCKKSLSYMPNDYRCPYCGNVIPDSCLDDNRSQCRPYRYDYSRPMTREGYLKLRDYGPKPFVVNIDEATKQNDNYRTALWTGEHLQLTLMSIEVGGDIGLEIHPDIDQFIRIEEGQGVAMMGTRKDRLDFQRRVYDGYAIFIPAGTWHNLVNTGNTPIKLYSIYAPPKHPYGTIQETKEEAMRDSEHDY